MYTRNLLFVLIFSGVINAYSQGVSVNSTGAPADPSAMLDVSGVSFGVLVNRMTTAERNAINNPEQSLLIYNITTQCFEFFENNTWQTLGCAAGSPAPSCSGPVVDARDGKTYNTILIGSQCWLKENLNYDQNSYGNDWCYNNDPANCAVYGRLYDWDAAMQGAASSNAIPSGVQGVCPAGWHLPSHDEWTTLDRAICSSATCITDFPYDVTTQGWQGTNEGDKLKANSSLWSVNTGNNSSGFTGLPAGQYDSSCTPSYFDGIGERCLWWTSTEYSSTQSWMHYLYYLHSFIYRDDLPKARGFSVRCIKN